MKILPVFFLLALLVSACSSGDVKEKINQAGDVAGQTVGEFASGISSGVERAFEVKMELSAPLQAAGISLGKVSLNDSSGHDNILTVYMIFSADFNGMITTKAFDKKGAEMGRVKVPVGKKKEEAGFVEFRFDPRTNIDTDSKIILE